MTRKRMGRHYYGDGCDISASCLDCPLPLCRYDDQAWRIRDNTALRDYLILEACKTGRKHKDIGQEFGVSARTVNRIARRGPTRWPLDKLPRNGDLGQEMTLTQLADRPRSIKQRAPNPPLPVGRV